MEVLLSKFPSTTSTDALMRRLRSPQVKRSSTVGSVELGWKVWSTSVFGAGRDQRRFYLLRTARWEQRAPCSAFSCASSRPSACPSRD